MPTITTVVLENFLEPRFRDSCRRSSKDDGEATEQREKSSSNPGIGGQRHIFISPSLYVTPEPTPIPENSSPHTPSPSPYVVNHKRRGGGANSSQSDVRCEVPDLSTKSDANDLILDEEVQDNFGNENEGLDVNCNVEDDAEGFFEPRTEGLSVGSFGEVNDFEGWQMEGRSFGSAQGEFFDANDDFSSSSFSSNGSSRGHRIESDLRATKLSLLEEIEKRQTAEDNLKLMCFQWERISNLMSQAGLTFPAPPTVSDNTLLGDNLTDQFSQEVVIARFVAEAIGRGEGRAEAELAATEILESKDQEISRLQDKLLYYETVNHEMSQRNIFEVVRRQQQRKKNRLRWLWSGLGLTVAIGASLVAYSYFPRTSKHEPTLDSSDSADASHLGS